MANRHEKKPLFLVACFCLAERERFELSEPVLRAHTISNRAPSASSVTSPRFFIITLSDEIWQGKKSSNEFGYNHEKQRCPALRPGLALHDRRPGSVHHGVRPLLEEAPAPVAEKVIAESKKAEE